jgi:hypothetical protein
MLLLIWTAFCCLMAAASYQLYPPVIVVFVYPHRRGEAVGG